MEKSKKIGRPKKEEKFTKRTLMIDDELYKALQIKAVNEGRELSEVIRQLLRDNIEKKYFINL